jgi:hypothetical protein
MPTGIYKENKGRKAWNKGLTSETSIGVKKQAQTKADWWKNNDTKKARKKMSDAKKGKKLTEDHKKKLGLKREKNPNWKGGITPINQKIRGSLEYKLWQDSVKNKDGNFCQKCGENRVSKIMAHHILNFSKYIELRFAIDNGITFCRNCHKEFHKKHGFRNNTREQLKEFLT